MWLQKWGFSRVSIQQELNIMKRLWMHGNKVNMQLNKMSVHDVLVYWIIKNGLFQYAQD